MTKLLNYTQHASQYIGQIDDEQQQSTKKTPTGIHLLDSNERIIDVLTNQSDKIYWDTKITEDQQDNLLTLDFTTLGNIDFSNVRKIIAQDQDGNHRLFVLSDIEKVHDENGLIQIIHADGDHVSLAQDQPIAPTTLSGATAETATQYILTNSRYQLGQVDFLGSRTVKFTDFLSPLAALNQIASDFDAILRFRVEIIGNTIQRYVDILEPVDIFSGKEFVFGKDIIGLKRKENRADIVTRLVGYGPADEDGNFITFEGINDGKNYVEDADAYQRWNDGGRHRYGIFQYQPEDTTDVTPQAVLDATKDALKRRNDAVVEYELTGAALEQIAGYEHEKVRVGMTIRIKDTYFEPALYLEAEVLRTEMPEYGDPNGEFAYTFGNYREVDISIPDDIKRIQSVLMKQQTRWTVAKDIADDAKQTAETAQQTADSKNKSSYGPNPPSNPKKGDIWFVTDGTDVVIAIRHWDGTQWVNDVDNVAVQQAIDEANQAAASAQQVGEQAQQTADQAAQVAQAAQSAADEATQAASQASTDATNAINQAQNAVDTANQIAQMTEALQSRMTDAENNISEIAQTTQSLTTQISAKADTDWVTSQFTQLADDINLRVSKDDIINQINLSTEGILIDGQKIHITGETTIDDAVITNAMIVSLSASKLTAGTIDASVITVKNINASNIITGTLDASKVTVTNIDASKINTGTLNAARIAAGSIGASKLNISTLSAISANLGNVTAGTINGVNISGSTFTASGGFGTIDFNDARVRFSGTIPTDGPAGSSWADFSVNTTLDGANGLVGLVTNGVQQREFEFSSDKVAASHTSGNDAKWVGFEIQNDFNSQTVNFRTTQGNPLNLDFQKVIIQGHGDGSELLRFNTERTWSFYQFGTDSSTQLALKSNSGSKSFVIRSSTDYEVANFYAGDSSSSKITFSAPLYADGRIYTDAIDINPNKTNNVNMYLRPAAGAEVRATVTGTTDSYVPIRAKEYNPPNSLREMKKNIEEFTDGVLDTFRSIKTYTFNYNFEEDGVKKTLGLMLDEAPEVIWNASGDSIDMYSSIGYLYTGVKQMVSILDNHDSRLTDLLTRVENLERMVNA